jgi:hypothetical protein
VSTVTWSSTEPAAPPRPGWIGRRRQFRDSRLRLLQEHLHPLGFLCAALKLGIAGLKL